MDYLADTVTIIRHFSGSGRIGRKARTILEGVEEGEHRLFLSTLSLVEILYLSEKKRIAISLGETLEMIEGSANYSIVDLTVPVVRFGERVKYPEIFDRLIISTAQYLDVPLITSDKAIHKTGLVETIWI